MKKLTLLIVAAIAFAFMGCRKPVEVSFDQATQEIDAQGGSIEVSLKSNGEWTIAMTEGWVMVSSMKGNGDATLTLTVAPNTTGESRTTEITASTKDNTAVLTLTQNAPQYYVNVNPLDIVCGASGGEFTVEVSSNVEWEVITPQWVTSSMMDGSNDATLTLTISPMEGDHVGNREGEVVISGPESVSAKVNVIQSVSPSSSIQVVPENLSFACTGETKTVAVTAEDSWIATVGEEWVVLNQNEGQGIAEISVTVGENPVYEVRQTNVVFNTVGGAQAVLVIRQEASPNPHFLEVSPLVFQFGKEGGEREISVSCDADWGFDLDCDWLSLSQQSGTGNATVVLTAEPNMLLESRTMDFRIKSGVLNAQLTASQAPGDEPIMAGFEPDTMFVSFNGGVQTLQLTSNTTWQLQVSSWITLITSSGEGDATFDIVVNSNSEPNERIGFVRAIHNGQVLGTMIVVQEGKVDTLEADITELDVRPEGGSFEIQVSSNQSWTVNTDVEWIHCDPLSDFGNKILTVTVDAMEGFRPRTGHVKLSGEMGNSVSITVNQH
ncbi:MAG: BACON domain-containing protein [Bacteroidales bacterium]|nr:BACON domain-containing protein [Bacteroidales bacterium]